MTIRSTLLTTAVTFALAGSAFAEGCDKIIFSDVGWTDITATTAATTLVLQALGYETETKILAVPVTYTGLAEGDIDVFLGNWMPTMEADIAPYRDAGTVDTVRTNLEGAKYTLATKLVNELVEAADDKILAKTIARYGRVDLLCIDELGYMELDKRGAELLFQVLTEREEKNSVAIASNDSFSGWTKTFTDARLCAAIVDRLTFGGNIIETGTDSYRLARTKAQQAAS